MKRLGLMCVIVFLFFAFIGCDTGKSPPLSSSFIDLPYETISGLESDGFYRFYTNEPKYYGWRFWELDDNTNSNPNIYKGEGKKISGAQNVAFGMLFGAVDPSNNYFVNITVKGEYYIGKRIDNIVTTIQGWTASTRLIKGFNALNTVAYSGQK